ncbi:MAG TPA: hypothetical protein VJM33_01785 [Microthrixaceae bacterium]|nr:hypothetical protein [Microthrixaceae bacterium]
MIRLAWRQFRSSAVIASGALAAVCVVVVLTRVHIVDVYDATVASCDSRGDCEAAVSAFVRLNRSLQGWLDVLVVVVPGLLGIFWGAPLVARELEAGTFRLAWTQSVTRTRWLTTKLAVVGLAAVVVSGVLTVMVTWWSSLFDKVGENIYGAFDRRDLVPIGHATLAFMVGVTAGVVLRRTLAAMATTLVVVVATRLAFVTWVRPHLLAAKRWSGPLDPNRMGFMMESETSPMRLHSEAPRMPNAWIRSVEIVDRSGRPITYVEQACPNLPPPGSSAGSGLRRGPVPDDVDRLLQECVAKVGERYHLAVSYQPAGRYWAFQWLELGIYVAASAALVGLCVWWVRRRL